MKKGKKGQKKESWWKRRIGNDITSLRKDITGLKRERQGQTGEKGKKKI